ncbi:TonB-dependent receptor domain-containing protein [Sphingobium sp.]|uniref:TonB-dependent receptor n=1 Tax=Sphingobium sp. TaxID=1912891 RepID=UPI0028BF229A|nr:TonB-dependent receptor [Sphingobium sp.]
MRRLSMLSYCASTLAFASSIAFAQDAPQSAENDLNDNNEILVTASRRGALAAQDVPIAITPISPNDLNKRGLGSLQDFSRSVPALNIVQQTPGVNKIDMRGLTTGTTSTSNIQDRPLVAVYLDDVPMSLQGYSPDIRVFDLERIEVIRGPQGTLYGSGSMAGTIRYITAKPRTDGIIGSVEGNTSFTENGGLNYSLRGILNLPVSDTIAIRLGGYQGRNDGFIDNVGLGKKNVNSDESTQFRGAIRWTPNDALTIDGSITYARLDVGGYNTTYRELGKYKFSSIIPEHFKDDLLIYNATLEYDLGGASIISSSSYLDRSINQKVTFEHTGPQFGLPGKIPAAGDITHELKDFSQEVRLFSTGDRTFNWTMGAYYQRGKRGYTQDNPSPGFDAAMSAVRGTSFSSLSYGAFKADTLFSGTQDVVERQVALFGEGTLKFGPAELTGGLRYFNWRQTFDLYFGGIAGALGVGRPIVVNNGKAKVDGFNPRFVASVKPSNDMMVYVEAARGFRYGGVNQPVATTICAADLAAAGRTEAPLTFGPDNLWSYTVGSKNEFLDRRVSVNVAGFYVDWKDVQSTRNLACRYRYTENAGKVRSMGLELESRFRLTDAFTLSVNGSVVKAEANGPLGNIGALDGNRVPFFPKYTLAVSGEYVVAVADGDLAISADFQARGNSYTEFNPANPRRREIPASQIVNAAINYTKNDWELGLFVQNLTSDKAVSLVTVQAATQPGDRYYVGRPRTIGVRLKRSF